ncbi:MAG: hypothetical protein AAF443_04745 [Chlamydiota bacterium]
MEKDTPLPLSLFAELEVAWRSLIGGPIEDVFRSPAFEARGISELIRIVEAKEESELRKKLLDLLMFLKTNQHNLLKILNPSRERVYKIRHSGHFVDQKLKYQYPKKQLDLFDLIESDNVKLKVDKCDVQVKAIGIQLTPPEDRLLNAIQKLLYEKSQHSDPDCDDYYGGNYPSEVAIFGGEKKESPVLRIRPAELYKAYLGKSEYSGATIKFIKEVLMGVSLKKFLIVFDRKRKVIKKGKIQVLTDRIEEFQSLVRVIKYSEGLSEKELQKMNSGNDSPFEKKGEMIIGLNPILVEQINSKYVEYPSDINKRMTIAAGGHRHVTEAMNILRDYMLRELSSKRHVIEINKDRLPYLLKLDKYLEARQKKRVAKRIDDAIQANRNLGLISSIEVVEGSSGQLKYVFSLNASFQ